MNAPLWFSNLAFWSAQVALLVLIGALLLRLFEIHHPRIVLVYWRVLLALSLVLPFLQPWHRLQYFAAITIAPVNGGPIPRSIPHTAISMWQLPGLQLTAQIVAVVILAGIVLRFLILALGLLKLRQFRYTSSSFSPFPETAAVLEQVGSELHAHADFRLSPHIDSPVTFGFAAPMILLPQSFPSMDAQFQAAIICHELLHVRRRDWAHHLTEEGIRAFFWFHPAIVWLISRVRLAREQVVDFEVVMLTNSRKTYLKALLEFTAGAGAAPVPAPPFLAERQLADRIALMLKEVRMSKTRLIASLTVIACSMAVTLTLAARTFPLKGSAIALPTQPIHSAVAGQSSGDSIDRNSIWTDTVQQGSMVIQVRGLGTMVRAAGSQSLLARVELPASIAVEVHTGQNARVDTHKGFVKAHVIGVSGAQTAETRSVDLGFDGPLPVGTAADMPVDATVDVGQLDNVVWVHRPVNSEANTTKSLFKLDSDGTGAERVNVRYGRASVQTIEILDGLKVGDKVILSDMSEMEKFGHIQLK